MLTPGSRLGPYEIVAPIGAGGMGEVFSARDTRLDRSVAIKVLPDALARDAEFKSRFEREARAISSLNHPNICTLYDVGHENGTDFLVMELIEGESLGQRLSKGPLPFDQIVRYGAQIAEALDRAHRAGVIHRDLKPGNVMLTKSGAKLLDFGLSKSAATPASAPYSGETQQMPITREGVVMGTFQYMAPEQIEGEAADARTDIFALGAVLYEMATGKRAFQGRTRTSLIAAIVSSEPPAISTIQPVTPAAFERVVKICLRKDPEERWQNARDVAIALRAMDDESGARPAQTARRAVLPLLLAALAATATVFALYFWRAAAERDVTAPIRTLVLAPEKTTFEFRNYGAPPAISPDGTRIVFGAAAEGKPRTLWIRSLNSLTAKELPGTEGAMFPFWSADSRLVAFFTETSLKKVDSSGGGSSLIVCAAEDGRGGAWSPDGRTIVFGHRFSGLFRVAAGGGTPVQISKVDGTFASHRWPAFLPDGKTVLYLATPSGSEDRNNTVCMTTIDGKMQKPIVKATNEPHYLDGYLLVARDRILTAQKLDLRKMEITGEPVSLSEQQIETAPLLSRSMVSVSAEGTLVYQTGEAALNTRLTWFDRAGKIVGAVGDDGPYQMVSISPDGKTVAFTYVFSVQPNIWLFDVVRGVRTRLTFGNGPHYGPSFSPDSRNVAFYSRSPPALISKNLQTGAEEIVLGMPSPTAALSTLSWSPDSRTILFTEGGRATRSDLRWVSLGEGQSHTFLSTSAVETNGRFSPDGRWVAYQSGESGLQQIFVAPFPPTGAKWQISAAGGVVPRWRADGKELFYVVPGSHDLMAVPVLLGVSPQIGKPARLFTLPIVVTSGAMYDVTGDGQRFLVNGRIGDSPPPSPLIVVQNFSSELRQAVQQRD